MAEVVCSVSEVVVGRFQGRVDVFFNSLDIFQVPHVFEDGVAHLDGEELGVYHAFLFIEPDPFYF